MQRGACMTCKHEAVVYLQQLAEHINSDYRLNTVARSAYNFAGLHVYSQFRALLQDIHSTVTNAHETEVLTTVTNKR
jgi:hypothetical protein